MGVEVLGVMIREVLVVVVGEEEEEVLVVEVAPAVELEQEVVIGVVLVERFVVVEVAKFGFEVLAVAVVVDSVICIVLVVFCTSFGTTNLACIQVEEEVFEDALVVFQAVPLLQVEVVDFE